MTNVRHTDAVHDAAVALLDKLAAHGVVVQVVGGEAAATSALRVELAEFGRAVEME